MKKLALSTIIILLISVHIFSQNADSIKYKHGLGFAGGRTIGIGITYLYQPTDLGVQFVIGALENDFNVGITPTYTIAYDEMINLFLYSGNSGYYGNRFTLRTQWRISNSLGIGFEAHQKQFSFNLMFGIASYYWQYEDWDYGYTIEASLLYRL